MQTLTDVQISRDGDSAPRWVTDMTRSVSGHVYARRDGNTYSLPDGTPITVTPITGEDIPELPFMRSVGYKKITVTDGHRNKTWLRNPDLVRLENLPAVGSTVYFIGSLDHSILNPSNEETRLRAQHEEESKRWDDFMTRKVAAGLPKEWDGKSAIPLVVSVSNTRTRCGQIVRKLAGRELTEQWVSRREQRRGQVTSTTIPETWTPGVDVTLPDGVRNLGPSFFKLPSGTRLGYWESSRFYELGQCPSTAANREIGFIS